MPVPFFRWLAEHRLQDHRWLILGKGPSLDRLAQERELDHVVLALNDAYLADKRVDVVHITDYPRIARCGGEFADWLDFCRNTTLVMPWRPHVDFRPGKRTLFELVSTDKLLGRLMRQGRLLYYHSSLDRSPRTHDAGPVVPVRYFSSVAAVNLLALGGVKKIDLLGVDGGTQYSKLFAEQRPLANGRSSFDAQLPEIKRSRRRYQLHLRFL